MNLEKKLQQNQQVYFYLLGAKFIGTIIKIFDNYIIVKAKIGNTIRTVKLYRHAVYKL